MPDDRRNTGKQDRERISLTEDYEVKDWSKKFGVSSEELVKAVEAVGNNAKDVEAHLRSRSRNSK